MEPAIEKAENKLEYLSSDENAMRLYWERERSLHERANMINSAKERGIIEGKIEAAKSVLDILDDETIATRFDLDINLVRELRK